MQKFQFTTVDTILSKYHRDFKGLAINESDAVEWIGEALGFMKVASATEEAVAFLEVKNYQAPIPNGLHYIIQLARDNQWSPTTTETCTPQVLISQIEGNDDCTSCNTPHQGVLTDCQGALIGDYEVAYYRPFFDVQCGFDKWMGFMRRVRRFTPIRLANNSFFNSLVCHVEEYEAMSHNTFRDEYTIVQDNLRFNFKEGFVALAYNRQMLDKATGYPMVPDDESARAAITYYLGWKFKEQECWNHREGSCQLADRAEAKWLKYVKQFKSKAKMPTGVDDYQDLMDQSLYMIPRHKAYYGFFGRLNTPEDRTGYGTNLFDRYGETR